MLKLQIQVFHGMRSIRYKCTRKLIALLRQDILAQLTIAQSSRAEVLLGSKQYKNYRRYIYKHVERKSAGNISCNLQTKAAPCIFRIQGIPPAPLYFIRLRSDQ